MGQSAHRYAILTALSTFLLLIAGGLVTSTDSGLSVPDWPLSYGMWFPPMVGGIRYEHGHRMIAGLVGLMLLALAVWLWRVEPRRWVRRLGAAALGAVVVQALLGGLTVLLLLPPQVSIAHACLGQLVFCLVVCLAAATARQWEESPRVWRDEARIPLRVLGVAVAGLAALQLLLGALIRHTGEGLIGHIAVAVALSLVAAWTARRARRLHPHAPMLWRGAARLLGLIGAQLLLGIWVLLQRRAVAGRTAHVAVGALILAQAVLLAWEIVRRTASAPPEAAPTTLRQRIKDYVALTKPRLSLLALVTAATGFWLGLQTRQQAHQLLPLLFGLGGVIGGANALNQWVEREPDALMQRTRTRPLPAHRLTPAAAFRFGTGLTLVGFIVLSVAVHPIAAMLAVAGWASYLVVYTPLKRRTPLCTLVGAVSGALPPMIGWAAARGALGIEAWALFALLFVWQLPHFLALAVLYRDDYARAGFRMLSLLEPQGAAAARQIAGYGVALVPISLFPALVGMAGRAYFFGTLLATLALLAVALRTAWLRSVPSARQLFRASLLYLPTLLGLLAVDRAPFGVVR